MNNKPYTRVYRDDPDARIKPSKSSREVATIVLMHSLRRIEQMRGASYHHRREELLIIAKHIKRGLSRSVVNSSVEPAFWGLLSTRIDFVPTSVGNLTHAIDTALRRLRVEAGIHDLEIPDTYNLVWGNDYV